MRKPGHFLLASLVLVITLVTSGPLLAQPAEEGELLEENWDILRMAGAHVGYVHSQTRSIDALHPIIETALSTEMSLGRMGTTITVKSMALYREDLDGRLISVRSTMDMSSIKKVSEAVVKNDRMEISTQMMGQAHTTEIPWDSSVLGPHAQTLLLRQTELKPGAKASFKMFEAEMQKIVTMSVEILEQEEIEIHGKARTLWRGTMQMDILPGVVISAWLDDKGDVIRSITPIMGGLETLRATREQALKTGDAPADIMLALAIKSNVPIENPYQTKEALFRIEGDIEDLKRLALTDRRQTIEKEMPDGLLLRIHAVGDAPEPAAEQPGPEHLASSPYIQMDDPQIVQLARSAAGDAKTSWDKAKRLEAWVYKNLHKKNLGVGFASAKEVAKTREGDCTEHAVLLAALLRAEGIPSRVATGLIYWNGIFGYHMWTEAFLNDWTALDATLAEDVVDAVHIRFTESALKTGSPSSTMLSVVPILGKIKLTVEEVKH